MEGPAGGHFANRTLFFILGAGDGLVQNLKMAAVRITRRSGNDLGYLLNLPIGELMEVIEMFVEDAREEYEARKMKR